VNFFSVFVIFTLDVLALSHPHSWERTSSVCNIYLYSVFARPPPTLFPTAFPSCVFLFSLLMCTPMCYLFEGLLVRCSFLSSSRTISLTPPRYQLRQKMAQLIFRVQNYVLYISVLLSWFLGLIFGFDLPVKSQSVFLVQLVDLQACMHSHPLPCSSS
jgi:hypothetical protein